ncbi:MAG: hypothetical protein Q9219_000721 [cf. Caloplaca sp. 3 TL-2023]
MLVLCLEQFRVIPEFVEFLFAFGYQAYAEDPYFGSFRQRTRLDDKSKTSMVPELAWSGHEIQLCYNLKSAERSNPESNNWSIRDCAIHHTWDAKNVRANWIIIKANDLIRRRIEDLTDDGDAMSSYGTLDRGFAASLGIHVVLCVWAAEQWRWYIKSLENDFRDLTRRAVTIPVTTLQTPRTDQCEFQAPSHTNTEDTIRSLVSGLSPLSTKLTGKSASLTERKTLPAQHTYTDPETGLTQQLPPHITIGKSPDPAHKEQANSFESAEEQEFSFAKLQNIHHIQEKARAALLILRINIRIISQLNQYYATVVKSRYFPGNVARLCQDDLEQFDLQLTSVVEDLQMQILRSESLVRLIEDRKVLLRSILDYQNTEANKASTRGMVSMTVDMNDIARKTKIETVSMKVITLVTLVFLPGTFISTDKPRHTQRDPYIHLTPLQFFLTLSLPLTLITILIWATVHQLEKHRETLKAKALPLEA